MPEQDTETGKSGKSALRLIARWKSVEPEARSYFHELEEIARFIRPASRGFVEQLPEGSNRTREIFDSTAKKASLKLRNAIKALLTTGNFLKFKFTDEETQANGENRQWLENAQKKFLVALSKSNFNGQVGETFWDMVDFGSGAIGVDHKKTGIGVFRGFVFRSYHLSRIFPIENDEGVVDRLFWQYDLTAEQAVERFKNPGDSITEALQAEKPDTEFKFLMWVGPQKGGKVGRDLLPDERLFEEVHINIRDEMIVKEDGFFEQPIGYERLTKTNDSRFGFGFGHLAIDDVKTLNEAERLDLDAWGKSIDPPFLTEEDNIVGTVDRNPGGQTVCRDISAIRNWETVQNLVRDQIRVEDKRRSIRDTYLFDQIDLPPREDIGAMTAFESAKRLEKALQIMGPVTSNLINLLDVLLTRAFMIQARAGDFEAPPESIGENLSFEIEFIGPLARAANIDDVDAMDRLANDTFAAANANPNVPQVAEMIDNIDIDEYFRIKAERLGVPEKVVRDQDAVDKIRQDRQAAAELQAEIEQAKTESETKRNLSLVEGGAQ